MTKMEAMPHLSAELSQRLNQTLVQLDYFQSLDRLRPLFVDQRIALWRDGLPHANQTKGLVEQTIAYLMPLTNTEGQNGLVLLLQILAERHNEVDQTHHTLRQLAADLDAALTFPPFEQASRYEPQNPYRGLRKFTEAPEDVRFFFGRAGGHRHPA